MQLIDLTLTISEKLPSFPGSPQPQFIPWSRINSDGYNLELLFLNSHSGTHIDAPYHFYVKGTKIHQISPSRLFREATLVKIKRKANEAITKNHIIQFEKKYGKFKIGSTIVFSTGWQRNFNKKFYFGSNPGLSLDAATYLVSKKVNLIGIDSPSIDLGKNSKFPVHKIFAKNNVLIVENLCNLDKISSVNFKIIVLPLKLSGATGSPVRAVAI